MLKVSTQNNRVKKDVILTTTTFLETRSKTLWGLVTARTRAKFRIQNVSFICFTHSCLLVVVLLLLSKPETAEPAGETRALMDKTLSQFYPPPSPLTHLPTVHLPSPSQPCY